MGFVDNVLRTDSKRVVSALTPMGNGYCPPQSDPPRYKRRRVSAVRTFPLGCGRFASRIFAPGGEAVSADTAANSMQAASSDAITEGSLIACGMSLDCQLVSMLPRLGPEEINPMESDVEERQLSFNLSNGIEPVSVGAERTLLREAVEALNDAGTAMPIKASERKTVDASKDFLKVDASCPLEENVPRNYPQRRRISAVRHFPPFCGRNAPLLVRGELPKLPAFTDARNISDEKLCCEEKPWQEPLRETLQGDRKQLGENFKDANAYNWTLNVSRLTGNRVPAESDGPANEETRNQMESRAASTKEEVVQVDVRDQSNKYTRECIQNHSNLGGLAAGKGESKGKRNDFVLLKPSKSAFKEKTSKSAFKEKKKQGNFGGEDAKKNSSLECAYKKSYENGKFKLVRRPPHNVGASLPPFHPSGSSAKGDVRIKVRETLRLFHTICRKLLQEDELKAKAHGNGHRRYDLQAAKILKEKGKCVNTGKQIIGSVPGVEVGDEFQYRVELNIIGLHRQIQGGIDYLNQGGYSLATSIVASGGYDDETDETDVLIYVGQGGNMNNGFKEPENQELTRGNRALKNSKDQKNPVRVIRGDAKVSDSSDSRGKTYIYDGLYLVEKVWQELGPHGKLIYKFKLVRIPGQPDLSWKVVKKSKKSHVREGLCFEDISQGKESIAICAVNIINNEKPPPFEYVPHMIYPAWCHQISPKGCDCNGGCFESWKCSCVAENGGEFPYNHNGAIVESKPIVYECGPSCKCPPSCYNRVSQRGIKFQLEIFKTESRGWGVRSLNSIPSGSFICEYAGELLEDKEAEQRTGNDEYLFDIGSNCNDKFLCDGPSTLMPEVRSNSCEIRQDGSFTIDAARQGNVGRFINHSCSPNLYAQNVLYDHEDTRMPHIMLFAAENIPPLQELTYHYNYMIDQVFDSDGNIKKKSCYCGSSVCTGRMY